MCYLLTRKFNKKLIKMILNIKTFLLGISILSSYAAFAVQDKLTVAESDNESAIITTAISTATSVQQKPEHIRAGQAKALLAIEKAKYEGNDIKTVIVNVSILTDNQGQKYLAGLINKADIEQYLTQLKTILGERFDSFREHQSARDQAKFHVTIVNSKEYQTLMNKEQMIDERLRMQLHGLGRVSQGQHTSYFVVATSTDGEFLRQKSLLQPKDFHVTLGFKPKDVHGVEKNKKTLIK